MFLKQLCHTTFVNQNLTNDIKYALDWNNYFLLPIGIWIDDKQSFLKSCCNKLLVLTSYFLMFLLLIANGLYAQIENPQMRMTFVGPLSFCVMAILKFHILVVQLTGVREMFSQIKEDWANISSEDERIIMLNGAKSGRKLGFLSAVFLYSGALFFHAVVPISILIVNSMNKVTVKPLTYPVYSKFIDTSKSPTYEVVFLIELFIGYLECNITIALCSLAAVFIMHCCAQLNLVMHQINVTLEKRTHKGTVHQQVVDIIKKHQRALRFLSRIEETLNLACLVECLGSGGNICFIGYYFLKGLEQGDVVNIFTFLILFVSVTFNIFILCYIGEIIKAQCEKIGVVCYTMRWNEVLPVEEALNLMFIIKISQTPAKITAGKFVNLCLSSFTKVIKSAMAYLNVLRAMSVDRFDIDEKEL